MTLEVQLTPSLESRLRAEANARGEDVETFVVRALEERLISRLRPAARSVEKPSVNDFEEELDQLTFNGPGLPGDFSRADIYNDHD